MTPTEVKDWHVQECANARVRERRASSIEEIQEAKNQAKFHEDCANIIANLLN